MRDFTWTRREALGAMAAAGLSTGLPAAVASPFPVDALHDLCRETVRDPVALRLGAGAVAGRSADELEAALRARVPDARDNAEWRAALVACGREDIARGDRVDVDGWHLMRVEADFLALGARLAQGA